MHPRHFVLPALTLLAACNPADGGTRNVDYFVIGDFDTRKGVEANIDLLKDAKKTEIFGGAYVVEGLDRNTGKHVEIEVFRDEIYVLTYSLAMNTYLHAGEDLRAVEAKYGFDLLPGRDVTDFSPTAGGFVINYACDGKKSDLCSMTLYSMNDAKTPITNITWTNRPLWDRVQADRLKETQAKLP
ncbi:hypothetical protein VPK21_001363 (plasmid) [Sinorhizobium kummerowiae]|uniref:Lipoprotein n=1 Tax=Sinorhizobium kummerowiae TaxID=158892 RepID=A0ABY8TFR9_9HYPH|nr:MULTISPECIES: hypothetical protein [Sinorhizobium]RVN89006.1 hypothetical protein CN105_16410 [Sinorhizobium meliloti]WHS96622.1 hypothetical protein PZL22_005558 [Sinorhizobium kummerowiae]WQH41441.1 hypothetical protein VPK21_001363 [Sinorhizobium kummerowiae]